MLFFVLGDVLELILLCGLIVENVYLLLVKFGSRIVLLLWGEVMECICGVVFGRVWDGLWRVVDLCDIVRVGIICNCEDKGDVCDVWLVIGVEECVEVEMWCFGGLCDFVLNIEWCDEM